MTSYEYDDAGRVVRTITVREPEFSEWDVAVLLADLAESKIRKGRHGLPLVDALDPKNQFAYVAKGPVTDWAQRKLNEAEERFKKSNPNADMDSLHFWVESV